MEVDLEFQKKLSRSGLALGLFAAFTLSTPALAADTPPPPSIKQATARGVQDLDLKSTISVDRLKISLLQGDEAGYQSVGDWLCGSRKPWTVSEAFLKNFGAYMTGVVNLELKRLGYPLAGKGKATAFDTDIAAAPDFRVGAIISEVQQETCWAANQAEGWYYVKIDWALFSEKTQKVVYQASTSGLAVSKKKVPELPKLAVISSLNNFLAAPEFVEALKAAPNASGPEAGASAAVATTTTTSQGSGEKQTLKGAAAPAGGALKNQNQLRNAVVTLEASAGSGSGFFIDKTGYLLTNAHVVTGAKFARLKLQNGDKLVAEVVRVNAQTDVALLKASMGDMEALALRTATPDVGSDVFAIGSPLNVLNHSMTRGVLSADRVMQGRRVLQSDAAVTFGSSGGPLLDADGRVIGITRGGIDGGKGFNFFIPIEDALKALELTVTP
jgi:serine protease Do